MMARINKIYRKNFKTTFQFFLYFCTFSIFAQSISNGQYSVYASEQVPSSSTTVTSSSSPKINKKKVLLQLSLASIAAYAGVVLGLLYKMDSQKVFHPAADCFPDHLNNSCGPTYQCVDNGPSKEYETFVHTYEPKKTLFTPALENMKLKRISYLLFPENNKSMIHLNLYLSKKDVDILHDSNKRRLIYQCLMNRITDPRDDMAFWYTIKHDHPFHQEEYSSHNIRKIRDMLIDQVTHYHFPITLNEELRKLSPEKLKLRLNQEIVSCFDL